MFRELRSLSERCSRIFRRSCRRQFAEALGGKAKTCPLSSEESDGALSRSEAPHVFLRPASSPARHSFHGLKSVTGLVAQASACVV